jgi:predicted lipid-binding transport protein (Tim44 family)
MSWSDLILSAKPTRKVAAAGFGGALAGAIIAGLSFADVVHLQGWLVSLLTLLGSVGAGWLVKESK